MSYKTKAVFKVKLSDYGYSAPNEDVAQKIGEDIVQEIVDRTQSGVDKNGKSFKKYSPAYKKSFEFKVHRKSDKVNMTLTGDMLGLLKVTKVKGDTIVLGWDDETEAAKAFNHTTGDTLPQRDFLGLPDKVIEKIIANIEDKEK